MKTNMMLLTATLVIASVSVNAQSRSDKNNSRSKKQTTENTRTTQSTRSSERTITVQSQPAKPVNNVSRTKVTYRNESPKVVAVRSQSHAGAKVIQHDNKDFYYQSGTYYRKYNDNYIKVAPPRGLSIQLLPEGSLRVSINQKNYFYFEGVFYLHASNGYVVETPPVGAMVYALPADYERVEVNGVLYYEYNGILYSRVHYNGERVYQVVGYLD